MGGYRYVFGVAGTRGDFQPYLSLAVHLIGRGHEVRIYTTEGHCKVCADFKVGTMCTGGDTEDALHSDKMMRAMEQGDFVKIFAREEGEEEEVKLVNGMTPEELTAKAKEDFVAWKPHCYVTNGLGHVADLDPLLCTGDVVKVEVALQPQGGPPSNSFKSIVWERELPEPDTPLIFTHIMLAQKQARDSHGLMQYMVMSGSATEDQVLDSMTGPETVFHRQFEWHKRVEHMILAYSPAIFPPPDDWPDFSGKDSKVHLVGNLKFTKEQQDELSKGGNAFFTAGTAHETCKEFLAAGPAPVYIGWGSMIVYGSQHMTKLAVTALRAAKQRGVIVSGWAKLSPQDLEAEGLEELRDYAKENVLFLKSAPHEWLFPQCCCCVHHGGIGTMQASLGAGTPTIITPVFADQESNAAALTKGGWGLGTTKLGKLKSKELGEALKKVCSDPSFAERTAKLRDAFALEQGITRSTEVLESIVRDELLPGKYKAAMEEHNAELRKIRAKQLKLPTDSVLAKWNSTLNQMYPSWKEFNQANMRFSAACHGALTEGRLWCVLGSSCLAREGQDLKSPECGRYRKYCFLEQLEKKGSRLRVKKLKGFGPEEGWISPQVAGKDILEQITDMARIGVLQAEMYSKLFEDIVPAS